jgi:hypothetical protein
MAVGAGGEGDCSAHDCQEAERVKEEETRNKIYPSKAHSNDLLPSTRPHLLVSITSQ